MMTALKKKWLSGLVAGALMVVSVGTLAAEQKTLHIYNWSDYIAPDTVANFEKETGINVIYDVFDSNEVLEGKLMAGSTGFDLVVPSASFLERQLTAGVFQPLDKSKLPGWKNLDPELLKLVAKHDPDNKYAMPYMWATTGIGYNVDKVKAVLGDDAPVNSWDLVLKPENLEKLKSCGVSFLDAPEEIFATVLNYLGKDPNSSKADDYTGPATDLLLKLRPNIRISTPRNTLTIWLMAIPVWPSAGRAMSGRPLTERKRRKMASISLSRSPKRGQWRFLMCLPCRLTPK